MVDTAIVDDSNLGRLSYTGTWQDGGAAPFEWDGTTHGSQTTGSQVTFQFNGGSLLIWLNDTSFLIPLSGTQVEVYGTIGPTGDVLPTSTYLLDSASILTYVAANVSATTYQNQFYQSPVLQDGSHTLVITVTSQGYYWLDYLLYTPSSNNLASAPISSSSSLSSSSSTSSALSATSSAGSAASSTSSCPHANGSQSSSIPVGAIAGGVVGGFILGALLIAGLLYCWKRNPTGTSKENRGALESPGKSLYPIDNFVWTPKQSILQNFGHCQQTHKLRPLSLILIPQKSIRQPRQDLYQHTIPSH
ncbi:hypothetical protein PHLCEN_2v13111 [Hermanssonia centrifuga]|uniref:Uncharacterized protein n=1 Tax=Hermanssonia centrifuga TaxID=98765 RepID=A0A2R6NF45_9APHY|nr:hypothetical protein PHLCEN_2v13111 [Hermanssonia centrifuga]